MRPRAHAAPGGGLGCGPASFRRLPPAAWPLPQPPASYAPRPAAASSAPAAGAAEPEREGRPLGALWTPPALSLPLGAHLGLATSSCGAPRPPSLKDPLGRWWEVWGSRPTSLKIRLSRSRSTRQPSESSNLRRLLFFLLVWGISFIQQLNPLALPFCATFM